MATIETSPKIADGITSAAAARGTPGQVLTGMIIACLVLALLASRGLQSWADAKGDSVVAMWVGDVVERWSDGMDRLGLTAPHDALRQLIRRMENGHWE